jgi:serine/threonine-protein kinase
LTPGARSEIDTVALAHEAADRALALDPASSRALTARAYVRIMSEFDWAGAESDYRAAIASDSRDAGTRQWYAELLAYQRRQEESAAQYDAALALDPLAPIIHQSRGVVSLYAGDLEMALAQFDEALRLVPKYSYSPYLKVETLIALRRFDEAVAAARDLPDADRAMMTSIVAALEDSSRSDEAVRQIKVQGGDTIPGKPFLLALEGRPDLALPELERLFGAGDAYRVFLGCMTIFDPLHDDPRFQALLRRIGMPAQTAATSPQQP